MFGAFIGYGLILQALAVTHFVRRRPDTFWLWIILFGGGLGAVIYIVAEVIPDVALARGALQVFPRRQRIKELQAIVLDNPSVGNFEELGDLYLDDGQFARARECFDKAITPRTDGLDPFYHRALSEIGLEDFQAAADDLARVTARDPKYDYHRASGLLAHVLGKIGRADEASALFARVTEVSTASETQYHYAIFLADHGRPGEARQWAERLLAKKLTMPRYLRRRERPWFRKAKALLDRLPAGG